MKIGLHGLSVEQYMHPQEKQMKLAKEYSMINEGLNILNDLNVSLVRRITLGRHMEATSKTAPELMQILEDVCRILDYQEVPRVYICHQAAQTLCCAGADKMQITISDYIIEHFDRDMLYYAFGNLISMFKAGHVKLVTVCSMLFTTPQTIALELPILAYLRAADLSSDRGGLLACQNFSAVAKVILWNAGIPLEEMKDKSEEDMIALSEDFIRAVDWISSDWLTSYATEWKKWNKESMPMAYKLKELLTWYREGYPELLGQWNQMGGYLE
ncbi:MAG: hypothetical protein IKW08_03815 [Roseburia sp.]|nr:hypothetical protein [Roseburia sp.]